MFQKMAGANVFRVLSCSSMAGVTVSNLFSLNSRSLPIRSLHLRRCFGASHVEQLYNLKFCSSANHRLKSSSKSSCASYGGILNITTS